jgi:hypothetical protein
MTGFVVKHAEVGTKFMPMLERKKAFVRGKYV